MCEILVPYLDSDSPEWQPHMVKAKIQFTKGSNTYEYLFILICMIHFFKMQLEL